MTNDPNQIATLLDTLDHWLQGRVNICVAGLVSRLEHLETNVSNVVDVMDCRATSEKEALLDRERRDWKDTIRAMQAHSSSMRQRVEDLENSLSRRIDMFEAVKSLQGRVYDLEEGGLDEKVTAAVHEAFSKTSIIIRTEGKK
jgi:hypothetical protein